MYFGGSSFCFEFTELLGSEIYCSHEVWRHFGHYSNKFSCPPPFCILDPNSMYIKLLIIILSALALLILSVLKILCSSA